MGKMTIKVREATAQKISVNEGTGRLVDITEEFQAALEYANYCFKGKAFLDEMRKIDDKKMSYSDAKEWQVEGIGPVVDRLKVTMSKFVTQLQHSIDAL